MKYINRKISQNPIATKMKIQDVHIKSKEWNPSWYFRYYWTYDDDINIYGDKNNYVYIKYYTICDLNKNKYE